MKRLASIITLCAVVLCAYAQTYGYKVAKDVSYQLAAGADAYRKERCVLDVYTPAKAADKSLPVVIFFHGGSLNSGQKTLPEALRNQNFVVVTPNYRLSPKVQSPTYVEDAAEAVAWTVKHIAEYGGDPKEIIVTGHSAGGYLVLMLALDKQYLGKWGVDADSMAAYAPLSGQTCTHYTIRKERGLDASIPVIDDMAPLAHARKLGCPMILATGDRNLEMTARYAENQHMQALLNAKGNNVPLYELQGLGHVPMINPSLQFVIQLAKKLK